MKENKDITDELDIDFGNRATILNKQDDSDKAHRPGL